MRKIKNVIRNFEICKDPSTLVGTDYMGICPGRYPGNHWSEGSIFIGEGSFVVIEGIFRMHFKKYMHGEINNISRTKGRSIASDLRGAAEEVLACTGKEILGVVEYSEDRSPKTVNELIRCKAKISGMLAGLADYMDTVYEKNDWICVVRAEP